MTKMTRRHIALLIATIGAALMEQQSHAEEAVVGETAHRTGWAFYHFGDRLGWEVAQRLTGAVLGGALWLTPRPSTNDPKQLSSPTYQRAGDRQHNNYWDRQHNNSGGDMILSPKGLGVTTPKDPQQQLRVRVRLINLSPATDLYLKWKSASMGGDEWQTTRFPVKSYARGWQDAVAYVPTGWRGTIDQIGLQIPDTVIRGDLWIREIAIEEGELQLQLPRADFSSERVLPEIEIPGLSQRI
jgi:hypothetical protein